MFLADPEIVVEQRIEGVAQMPYFFMVWKFVKKYGQPNLPHTLIRAVPISSQVIGLPMVLMQIQAFSRCGLFLLLQLNKSGIRPRRIEEARVA